MTQKFLFVALFAVVTTSCANQKPHARIDVDDSVSTRSAVAKVTPAPAAEKDDSVVGGTVRFEYNSYVLEPDAVAMLDRLSTQLRSDQTAKILIEGHTDDIGSDAFNLALGEARARSVRNYLVKSGVPSSRVSMISYGKERPYVDGTDDGARAANRRGELVLK